MLAGLLRLPFRSPHLEPGMRLGKYRIVRRLAVGGMAEIFLARKGGIRGFEKLLVVKRLQPQYVSHPNVVRMFLDEARLMATLNHPNITQVNDVGEARGTFFFAMEYVHGEDLRALQRAAARTAEPLPLDLAVGVIAEAAAGLQHAHDKRGSDGAPLLIVHRDVSPSNVLVSYDGAVKLTDFGVAKWARQEAETRHGTLKGKCAYMSPEQCRGDVLDRRSDVFALGILLYELSTGTRLFQGASDFAILNQIVSGKIVPPSERRPGYPPALERIVLRALERDPGRRFATARDLQLALEAMAHEERYTILPVARAHLMQRLFERKLAAWRVAEIEGRSLGQHLASLPDGEVVGYDEGTDGGTGPGVLPGATMGTRATGLEMAALSMKPSVKGARPRRWVVPFLVAGAGAALAYAWRNPVRPPPIAPLPHVRAREMAQVPAVPVRPHDVPSDEPPGAIAEPLRPGAQIPPRRTGPRRMPSRPAPRPEVAPLTPSPASPAKQKIWDSDSVLLPK